MTVLTVNLGENSYDILIDSGSLNLIGERCVAAGLPGRVALITNPTVAALYGAVARKSLEDAGYTVFLIEIPDGEEYKNSTTLNNVYDGLIAAGLDRKSFIVALGGGVVGDLAGFAAATYLRGIPFVQVPTTLLAQVDSSVGGKTAIDHPLGKNLIGAFYQPRLVIIDVNTLTSLPEREFRAGMAEVIKYGVALDATFFEYLEQNADAILALDQTSLIQVVHRCCELKAGVVELDEKEAGPRAVLNFGHTLGHAFETLAGYRELVHGEAVAIGMALASRISMALGHCSDSDRARIISLIAKFGLPQTPPISDHYSLLDALAKDKKSRGGTISFICNQGIGNHVVEKLQPGQLLYLSALELEIDTATYGEEIIDDLEIIDIDEADLIEEEEPDNVSEALGAPDPKHHDPLSTATLAELYVQQGFIDKALGIYHAILAADPNDSKARSRIAELEAKVLPVKSPPPEIVDAEDSAVSNLGSHELTSPLSALPVQDAANNELSILEGWLDNIRKIKACR